MKATKLPKTLKIYPDEQLGELVNNLYRAKMLNGECKSVHCCILWHHNPDGSDLMVSPFFECEDECYQYRRELSKKYPKLIFMTESWRLATEEELNK